MSFDVSANRNTAANFDVANESAPEAQAAPATATSDNHVGASALPWNPQLSKIISSALAANNAIAPAAANADGASGPSFDAQVRGQDAKPIDLQLAQLSSDVYETSGSTVPGWTRLSGDDLAKAGIDANTLRNAGIDPNSLVDKSTGFQAAIYRNDQGQIALAFAGTDPLSGKDWFANGSQAAGLPTAQYTQAVTLATQAKRAFGDNMVITGHSLGGGLASVASAATNSAAVTFNASGVNDATLRRYVPDGDPAAIKQEAENGLVRRYAVKGDILTGEQETGAARGFAPDAIGHKIELQPAGKLPWISNIPGLNLLGDSIQGIKLHLSGSVIDALKQDQPWNPGVGPKEGIVDRIADGTGDVGNKIVDGIDAVKNGTKNVVGGIFDGIGGVLGHVPLIGGLLKGGAHLLGNIGKGIIETAGNVLDGVVGVGTHLLQGAEKLVGGAITSVVDAGKKVGGWLVDGAKAVGGAVVDGAKAVGGAVVDGVKTVGHVASKLLPWNW